MIIFAHLLNDRSGSPRVLSSVVAALIKPCDGSRLFIGSDGAGCLNESGIDITRYWYRRSSYRLLTLFTYFFSQCFLLVRLLSARGIKPDALIYVNTLLPFGAALYGWMTKRTVIYHLHEVSITPLPLRWFLTMIARLTAQRLIYVSDYHRANLPIADIPATTVHNALDSFFYARTQENHYQHRRDGVFTVLMVASLRDFKGVPEFLALADRLVEQSDIRFDLVANDDEVAIARYFADKTIPVNVAVHPRTSDPALYYAGASLVLNLSRPDQCQETFGLTLLEAMSFGVPVIAPPVGGPVEFVEDGVNGYLLDSRNGKALEDKVVELVNNPKLCMELSEAVREKAKLFSPEHFEKNISETILPLLNS